MKHGRVRTVSMVQRFAKTAIGEGFDLWDKDYLLGAMRLFVFKSESAPPFQVGPCLDATGEILMQMEEYEDASEQFAAAAEKYTLIQQPVLSELMRVKALECTQGPFAALSQLEPYLTAQEKSKPTDRHTVSALARSRAYHAELLLKTNETAALDDGDALVMRAVAAAQAACQQSWDRVHTGHVTLGDALQAAGQLEAAQREYAKAVAAKPNYILGLERQMEVRRKMMEKAEAEEMGRHRRELRELLDAAIALHPRSTLLREKAFLISEMDGDTVALAFLEPLIENPPPEEADATRGVAGPTVATLLKAKAAILADGGKFEEALRIAEQALRESPGDEEAESIIAELQQAA